MVYGGRKSHCDAVIQNIPNDPTNIFILPYLHENYFTVLSLRQRKCHHAPEVNYTQRVSH